MLSAIGELAWSSRGAEGGGSWTGGGSRLTGSGARLEWECGRAPQLLGESLEVLPAVTGASAWVVAPSGVDKELQQLPSSRAQTADSLCLYSARKLDQGVLIVRFEMPYNIWW